MGTQDASLTFTITGTSPSSATTATLGSVVDTSFVGGGSSGGPGLDTVESLDVIVATLGATGGTLDLVLETSPDGITYTEHMHFVQIAAAATAAVQRGFSTRWGNLVPVAVGQGVNQVLAAATIAGAPERFLRVIAKGGASTTAGAVQTLTLIATGSRKAG